MSSKTTHTRQQKFSSDIYRRFANFVDDRKLQREHFCSSMHPYLTKEELGQSFQGIGFSHTQGEMKSLFRDFEALGSNYLPMEEFLDHIQGHSFFWREMAGGDGSAKLTALNRLERLRQNCDALGGEDVQAILTGTGQRVNKIETFEIDSVDEDEYPLQNQLTKHEEKDALQEVMQNSKNSQEQDCLQKIAQVNEWLDEQDMYYKAKSSSMGSGNMVIQLFRSEPCPPDDNWSSKDILVQEMYIDDFDRQFKLLKRKSKSVSQINRLKSNQTSTPHYSAPILTQADLEVQRKKDALMLLIAQVEANKAQLTQQHALLDKIGLIQK